VELIPNLVRVAERKAGGYTSSMAFAALGQIGTASRSMPCSL